MIRQQYKTLMQEQNHELEKDVLTFNKMKIAFIQNIMKLRHKNV